MKFSDALRRTMFEFNLTGADLARQTGLSQNTVSAFKTGNQSISTENLEKILEAMPAEARRYYLRLLNDGFDKSSNDLIAV